ncbi:hypothetical protein AVEN_3031-1 [Araneus ventricosus]|uniref:Uncharacterized protein n=1 Tax=Araneus ventricosus TaxID=182803 RepID=A0A4Y2JUI7_ARAVE|nr:hypothetical protein AVEN_202023-1 [Araneus ventricosus]GBM93710.1 hypothetical protein AVEN_3031-1 [Araneus ventricosus]
MQERVLERQREVQGRKERASADDTAASSTSKILSAAAKSLSSPDKTSNSEGEEGFVPYFAKRKHETDYQQPQEQTVTLKKSCLLTMLREL